MNARESVTAPRSTQQPEKVRSGKTTQTRVRSYCKMFPGRNRGHGHMLHRFPDKLCSFILAKIFNL